MNCPHCGKVIESKQASKRRQRLPEPHPGPNATDAQLHKYYKQVSPYEDLLFVRRNASDALKIEIDALIVKGPTHADAMRIFTKRRIEATYRPSDEAAFWRAVKQLKADPDKYRSPCDDDPIRAVAHLKERNQKREAAA